MESFKNGAKNVSLIKVAKFSSIAVNSAGPAAERHQLGVKMLPLLSDHHYNPRRDSPLLMHAIIISQTKAD